MSRDLLLEIGLEEMPSAFLPQLVEDYKRVAQNKLASQRLAFQDIKVFATPRRLVLLVEELAEKQEDARIESRGPKKKAAFDAQGQPTKAALGFARSQGVAVEDLEIREVAGVEYLFAVKTEAGVATREILASLLQDILFSLPLPKSMRWGYHQIRFIRPIRWILALYGDELLDMQIENVKSSNVTYGHRFLSSGAIKVNSINEFFSALRQNYVLVDQEERKKLIWEQVEQVAASVGGKCMPNKELLEEVCYLVEYPTAFYGEFSPDYLEVPVEVLTTTMIENQKYFPVFDPEGKLMPGFIGVRNGTDYSMNLVKAGNERVIKARLEDALFFWKEDTRKNLEDFVPGLEKVMYHEKIGNMKEKVARLQSLAVFIGDKTSFSQPEKLERAAYLCKADLLSAMVYEFPELQGIMGCYYALKSGEDQEIAAAILEHYMPRFAEDRLPESETGLVLALAEKIDNLTGCFAIGIKPSGSQDPYALRRQALGIVNIILDKGIKLDLKEAIAYAYKSFSGVAKELEESQVINELLEFIFLRLRGVLLERGFSYDLIDAVLAKKSGDIKDIVKRAEAVDDIRQEPWFADFMVVFNRSNNLSKKWSSQDIAAEFLIEASEKKLYSKFLQVKNEVEDLIRKEEYRQAASLIADLRTEVDEFFDAVMVMVEDEKIRSSRLGLLKSIAELGKLIADFSMLITEK